MQKGLLGGENLMSQTMEKLKILPVYISVFLIISLLGCISTSKEPPQSVEGINQIKNTETTKKPESEEQLLKPEYLWLIFILTTLGNC